MLTTGSHSELFVTQTRCLESHQPSLRTRVYFSTPDGIFFFHSHENIKVASRRWRWLVEDYINTHPPLQNDSIPNTRISSMDWISDVYSSEGDSDADSEASTSTSSSASREEREAEMNLFEEMESQGWRAPPNGYALRHWITTPRSLENELTTGQLNIFYPGTGWGTKVYDEAELMELFYYAECYVDVSKLKGNTPKSVFAWFIRWYL